MNRIFAVFLSCGLVACGHSTLTLLDSRGNPVTVEQNFSGRGCIAVDSQPNGPVSVIVQQDGTSDWSGVRGVVSVLPTMVQAAIMALLPESLNPGGISTLGMEGPSAFRGCEGIFEGDPPMESTSSTEVQ